ncbi:MAG: DUF4038 domain-containing protein [Clostridia bacterium]|nr:DUF4038 domain-containing protein [Clostridia bacterium]
MARITLSADRRCFIRDDKPFFLMADTCWSAFTNPTMEEWEEYLLLRREQGFNAVMINVLPQWDRSLAPGEKANPFGNGDHQLWHFSRIPSSYFDHDCLMLDKLRALDMIPVLVLLWSNYTNGTFFDHLWGHSPMDPACVPEYADYVARRFRAYEPVYFVSGDTNFSNQAAEKYYLPALHALKAADPQALASLHICGDGFTSVREVEDSIPAALLYSPEIDFRAFQSGHFGGYADRCRDCAKAFAQLQNTLPVLNAEPCYEGWDSPGDNTHGAAEMRRTTWLSLLSGACAGLAYGAQGVWQWYREGDFFAPDKNNRLGERPLYTCLTPFPAWDALNFPGALDRTFARKLVEKHALWALTPSDEVCAPTPATCMAHTADQHAFAAYIPRNQTTGFSFPEEGWQLTLYHLAERREIPCQILPGEGGFTLPPHGLNSDLLLIGERK